LGAQFPSSLAAGDFNGDGKMDIAVIDSNTSLVRILPGNGDGPETPVCTVAGNPAAAVANLVSPGRYQINLTIPLGTSDRDSPIRCVYRGSATAAGTWIAVQY
jgi:uncharacterized protein (TIGR03437 family)